MTDYNLYRGSIFHCIENDSNVEPAYFPDGLMVVSGGRIVEVGEYSEPRRNCSSRCPLWAQYAPGRSGLL